MITRRTASLAAMLVLCCAFCEQVYGQERSPAELQKRNVIVFDGDLGGLLMQLAASHKVNIGFESIPLQPRSKIKIDTRFATIDDVLNAIVAADPRYHWELRDGFIDVYPQTGSCPLLDTMIKEIEFKNTGWSLASEILTSVPEVQSQMSRLRLSRQDISRTTDGVNVNVLSANMKALTLRRALHEITKASGRSFWIFERPREGVFSISLLAW